MDLFWKQYFLMQVKEIWADRGQLWKAKLNKKWLKIMKLKRFILKVITKKVVFMICQKIILYLFSGAPCKQWKSKLHALLLTSTLIATASTNRLNVCRTNAFRAKSVEPRYNYFFCLGVVSSNGWDLQLINASSRAQCHKTFYVCNIQMLLMFVTGKPFQPSLMHVSKAKSLPKSAALEGCFTWVRSDLTLKH